MPLTAGIVGLPNVGKSTLFNAITQAGVEAANYPFATIDPNVGTVEVPDNRLDKICEMYDPNKTVPTTFEFTDIAGLVKGASKGEGLGNQFLANIRQVDSICQVVRCFEDEDITHVEGGVNPIRDVEIINLELILSDLEQVERRIGRIEKLVRMKDKDAVIEMSALEKVKELFFQEKPARLADLTTEEYAVIKNFQLLTLKPTLYVANVSEEDIMSGEENEHLKKLKEFAHNEGAEVITVCAKVESEIAELDAESKQMFLDDLGIEESGLDKLIKSAYELLGLATYFTAGKKEVRAWTFIKGMTAPECAGIIHTDFQRGFIRAETVAFDDLVTYGSEQKVKEAGKLRLEGKEYRVKDGDILNFRFNV